MYSEEPKIPIERHVSKLDESMKDIFLEIRNFVLSLGSNVIEEVRPHRVVYAKSFNFRTFLDIEPMQNTLIISVKMEPRSEASIVKVNSREPLQDLKDMIREAYARI